MEKIINIFKEQPQLLIYVGLVAVSMIIAIVMNRKAKKNRASFLQDNPDAAKLILTGSGVINTQVIHVYDVNDEPIDSASSMMTGATSTQSQLFSEKMKSGIYIKPGKNILTVSYESNRPGVMYKSVTKYTDPVKIEIDVEPQKSYHLTYDTKEAIFGIEEI